MHLAVGFCWTLLPDAWASSKGLKTNTTMYCWYVCTCPAFSPSLQCHATCNSLALLHPMSCYTESACTNPLGPCHTVCTSLVAPRLNAAVFLCPSKVSMQGPQWSDGIWHHGLVHCLGSCLLCLSPNSICEPHCSDRVWSESQPVQHCGAGAVLQAVQGPARPVQSLPEQSGGGRHLCRQPAGPGGHRHPAQDLQPPRPAGAHQVGGLRGVWQA